MSAAVISFGVEVRILEPGSVRFSDSGARVDVDFANAPTIRKSNEGNGQGLCYEAACEGTLFRRPKVAISTHLSSYAVATGRR